MTPDERAALRDVLGRYFAVGQHKDGAWRALATDAEADRWRLLNAVGPLLAALDAAEAERDRLRENTRLLARYAGHDGECWGGTWNVDRGHCACDLYTVLTRLGLTVRDLERPALPTEPAP